MLHGAGIFANTPKKWPSDVGQYSSTMEHMGYGLWWKLTMVKYDDASMASLCRKSMVNIQYG